MDVQEQDRRLIAPLRIRKGCTYEYILEHNVIYLKKNKESSGPISMKQLISFIWSWRAAIYLTFPRLNRVGV